MNYLTDKLINRAKWITAPEKFASPVIIRKFEAHHADNAILAVSALGFFTAYVNGSRVGDEYFRPSDSLFCKRDTESFLYPIKDEFTYRCYYSVYDITPYLQDGENTLEIALGDGWFRQTERTAEGKLSFGSALGAIYAIHSENERFEDVFSDGSEQCRSSEITESQLFYGETYDARIKEYEYAAVKVTEMNETLLTKEIAPADREVRRIKPVLISETDGRKIYDAGENISGFAVVSAAPKCGERVTVRYAEQLNGGKLDFFSTGSDYKSPSGKAQIMEDTFIGDGERHIFKPRFVWHAFRYFEIEGEVRAEYVSVLHSDVAVTAHFHSSSEELNWLYGTFLRTQLNNMHGGVPSDCPHRERLGYTGDGQICSEAAMLMLDARDFYRKWIQDIFDSQDLKSGHVNHTAPFAGGGGGPGGWGCAAVFVPYNYFKIYGDKSALTENYPRMKKWIEYLAAHSTGGLVTSEEPGGWCLGDWCTPQKVVMPESYVNTCCFIKALRIMECAARISGAADDIRYYETLRGSAETSVFDNFYDKEKKTFCGGVQGADAFAVYCGIAGSEVIASLLKKYEQADSFDTGFIGTMHLIGALFENGGENIAYKLLTGHKPGTFGYMADRGATTLWETWDGALSQDHPMFGACSVYLITHILGITQEKNSTGFEKVLIAPKIPEALAGAEGFAVTPRGKISVKWRKTGGKTVFVIELPENTCGKFVCGDCEEKLHGGENTVTLKT